LQADLVIAADGVHSKAVQHVLDETEIVQAGDTGWACMRWLVPREDFLSDPETAGMIQDSTTRYFTAADGAAGLVWYPCRKCVGSYFYIVTRGRYTTDDLENSNEVQNFLYLSRDFDTSHVGEGTYK
jgi:salicylate hydroxylase